MDKCATGGLQAESFLFPFNPLKPKLVYIKIKQFPAAKIV
jgi:hypothetical protein